MARLFTVHITVEKGTLLNGDVITTYEADFAGIHFSRTDEAEVIRWVRVAARNCYGKDTQVIFLHESEGNEQ